MTDILLISEITMLVFIALSILSYIVNFSIIKKQREALIELDKDKVSRQN